MYISAVFRLIAMNWSSYSPTVTCCICAEFAAFTISGTKSVVMLAFGQVRCSVSKWSYHMGWTLKVVHDDECCMNNKFHA